MAHLPALDGLRGLAVIGVLLFHSGFEWARGGFLGVSTFFTLSGFLITNLLVREWDASGSIRLGGFWTRRFRRLLPAAVITIAFTGLIFWRLGSPEQVQNLRLDMLGALGYVANWRFYFAGTSYGSLFAAPSPLQHFWSLAIEEQFYVFFPPIVIVLMRSGGRRVLAAAVTVATMISVVLCVALRTNTDRVYYGTDTRAAELLLGVLLAIWWSGRSRRDPQRLNSDISERSTIVDAAGLVGLAVMFFAWYRVSETSLWLAKGGFPLYALSTTAIVLAATRSGVVTAILSNRFLRWAGLISYGLYLYHWPVFLVLDDSRVGWAPWPLFALRMVVTVSIALISYRLLEMPVRRGRMFTTGRSALSAGLSFAAVTAVLAVVLTLNPPTSTVAFADITVGDTSPFSRSAVPDQIPAPGAPGAVLILGDSGMVDEQVALEAAFHAAGTGHIERAAGPGVGLSLPLAWREDWADLVVRVNPQIVVVMLGGWDMRYIYEQGPDAYRDLIGEAVDILSARGAKILWLPMLPGGTHVWKTVGDAQVDEIIASLPDLHPGVVFSPDVTDSLLLPDGTYGRSSTDDAGRTIYLRKPEGWHLCQEGAARLAQAILDASVDLGLSPPAAAPWKDGSWNSAANFDDPPGACPR
jgi:peptidoglycan/LPS O-acetylase OafA/YrhL